MNRITTLIASVSADGKIADRSGNQSMLTCEADRAHLRAHIQHSDLLVLGRITFEEHRHHLMKPCAVLTSRVSEIAEIRESQCFWNPEEVPFDEVCQKFRAESVCLLGGANAYSLFREREWIDKAVLTLVPNAQLPDGRSLFIGQPADLWAAMNDGRLGFTLSEPPRRLAGTEAFELPWEVREYHRNSSVA